MIAEYESKNINLWLFFFVLIFIDTQLKINLRAFHICVSLKASFSDIDCKKMNINIHFC